MKRVMLIATIFAGTLLLGAQDIVVHIENIRNTKGILQIALFQDQQQFDNARPCISLSINKAGISNGKTTATFKNIAGGTYGIALLDDENSNGVLDKRFFIPEEGFGFSNFDQFTLTKPEFEDFDFRTDGKNTLDVSVKIRYF